MPRQRVVCVGNELCHDDGIANVVGHALAARFDARYDMEVVHVAEFGLSSLDAFLDVEHVVVIDAVTTGNQPGSCTVITNPEFVPSASCSIGHAVSLTSMLELVAELQPNGRVPSVTVIGIEAENLTPFGTTISPSVLAAVPEAIERAVLALGAHALRSGDIRG